MRSPLRAVLDKKGHEVHSVGPEEPVRRAVQIMNDSGIGALLVLSGGSPIGIFTERDVLRRVVAEGRDPDQTRVGEVMTGDLAVVGPATTVEEAMAICTEKRCRHLPVMEGDELLGLVSSGDLTLWVTKVQSAEIQDLVRYIRGEHPA
jgi:CBS domain-containing protein